MPFLRPVRMVKIGLVGLKDDRENILSVLHDLRVVQVEPISKAALEHFVLRLQREMEFNAAKDDAPYRDGQHDGMRFARDAILRILTGTYEPEKMVIERDGAQP